MKLPQLIKMIHACGHKTRVSVLSKLIRAEPKGMVAGKLSKSLGLTHTNLSFHLRILLDSGLITVQRKGQAMLYRVEPLRVAQMMRYMVGTILSDDYAEVIRDPERDRINFSISYNGKPLNSRKK